MATKLNPDAIIEGTITKDKLSNAVQSSLTKADSALSAIPDSGVTTAKIADGAVSSSKLAQGVKDDLVSKQQVTTTYEAIQLYADNTAEHKAANLANIKAYEDNLKAMGVDVTKGWSAPVQVEGTCNRVYCGILYGARNGYWGVMSMSASTYYAGEFHIEPNGEFQYVRLMYHDANESDLTTTVKQIIPAINEVNALAKSKASTAVATVSSNGLMSAEDKKKLDGVTPFGTIQATTVEMPVTGKNTTVSLSTTGVDGELEFTSEVDTVKLMNISDPTDAQDAATKSYVDTKVADSMITLAYNPDDSYMSAEQFKSIFTEQYNNRKIPNVELVYTEDGDYQVLHLTRIDSDETNYYMYFSAFSIENTTDVYIYGAEVTVTIDDGDSGNSHDMSCNLLQSTGLRSTVKEIVNNVDRTEVVTNATSYVTMTMASAKNYILMPTVGTSQMRLPSNPIDGYTLTFTVTGTTTAFELRTASSTDPIYNVGTGVTSATKYTAPTATRCKIITTYSSALKQWITYRNAIN